MLNLCRRLLRLGLVFCDTSLARYSMSFHMMPGPSCLQEPKLQSSSSAPRERRFAPALAAPAAGVESPVSPGVDPSTNPFADKPSASETNPFLDPALTSKKASAGRLSEDGKPESLITPVSALRCKRPAQHWVVP